MSYRVIILPQAESDIERLKDYYVDIAPDAVRRFELELLQKKSQLEQFPESSQRVRPSIRRSPFWSLPYAMYYRILTQQVEIAAILPQKFGPRSLSARRL